MTTTATTHGVRFLLDVHILLSAISGLGPCDRASDFDVSIFPCGDQKVRMEAYSNITTNYGGAVISSNEVLKATRMVLTRGYDGNDSMLPREARDTTTAYAAYVNSKGGRIYPDSAVHAHIGEVRGLIPDHLYGTREGQVDYEDLTVICTAMVEAKKGNLVVIVTDDAALARVITTYFGGTNIMAKDSQTAAMCCARREAVAA